ncbi:MAG: hypothetical protein J6P43_06830 [Succinivibrionaceae bacterium]|nr:hypothetical protein [Succinivibrionaceae bacterium]
MKIIKNRRAGGCNRVTFGAGCKKKPEAKNPFLQEADEFSVNCRNNRRLIDGYPEELKKIAVIPALWE